MKKTITSALSALLILGFNGCNSSSDTNDTELLAQASSYSDFKAGIIDANKLQQYIEDWKNNKPQNVNGRLVILQAGATSNQKFLPHNNDEDVVVYAIPAGGACDPSYMRYDGLSNVPGSLLSGENIDGMINMFHLDPENDYVVFAVGVGSTTMRDVVRSYWSMIYWGWSLERIAFLNGSIDYNFADDQFKDYLVTEPSTPPTTPSNFSVKTLATDRTNLHIYIDEMMQIAAQEDKSGIFIADARGSSEYNAEVPSKTSDTNCGPEHNEQCYSPFQGHIKDAVDFPYTDLLVLDDATKDINNDGNIDENDASFKFKSPAELQELYAQKGYKDGDKVITYCRTGRKATLIAVTSYVVLNKDVAMYDGSWIQWGEMANRLDVNGSEILPQNNKWITANDKYSVVLSYSDPLYTQSASIYNIDPNATSTQKIKEEDQAFLNK